VLAAGQVLHTKRLAAADRSVSASAPSATRNIAPRPHQTRKLVGADMPLEMQLAERDRDQVVGHGGNARMAIILITSSNLVEPLRRAGDNYSLEILLAR
jgi:hypothetical protein